MLGQEQLYLMGMPRSFNVGIGDGEVTDEEFSGLAGNGIGISTCSAIFLAALSHVNFDRGSIVPPGPLHNTSDVAIRLDHVSTNDAFNDSDVEREPSGHDAAARRLNVLPS